MIRFLAAILFSTLVMQIPVNAQQPATPSAADYVLVTVVLRHDQSRNLEEITKAFGRLRILGQVSAGRHYGGVLVRCNGIGPRCDAASTACTIARGESID